MSDYTFSAGISDDVRKNTEALFDWLNDPSNHDRMPLLERCMETGGIDIHAKDVFGYTILHVAAAHNNPTFMEWLLQQGAELDVRNKYDETPLHCAAQKGHLAALEWLHDQGADLNARTQSGKSMLHQAAESGKIPAMKWLLQRGADLEARDNENYTPLHSATQSMKGDALEWLLEQGADTEARTSQGSTALNLALRDGLHFLIDVLLNHGANLHVQNNQINWPLTTQCESWVQQAQKTFDAWHEQTLSPAELTKTHIIQMLNIWPLTDPQAPVPRFEHLDAIFKDERWNEVDPQQKLDLISEIPGLSQREQMYLLGGNAARVLMKNETQPQQGAER